MVTVQTGLSDNVLHSDSLSDHGEGGAKLDDGAPLKEATVRHWADMESNDDILSIGMEKVLHQFTVNDSALTVITDEPVALQLDQVHRIDEADVRSPTEEKILEIAQILRISVDNSINAL